MDSFLSAIDTRARMGDLNSSYNLNKAARITSKEDVRNEFKNKYYSLHTVNYNKSKKTLNITYLARNKKGVKGDRNISRGCYKLIDKLLVDLVLSTPLYFKGEKINPRYFVEIITVKHVNSKNTTIRKRSF
ncbi:MAG: hypothetical protein GY730_09875 [bacterium]|nr:hypothetical protein [bacterium]